MHDDVFRPGELCGTYRIIKLLGRGGFADVYQAIDVGTQQRVALKCLQLRHLTNAQITQRMVAETELLSGLDHPNVIQVEDAGINGGVLWLAMEYIAGGTLRERLRKRGGPLPPVAALKYARQVAEGVGAAHGMHVVHRDLKPENIMITDKDEVKVLDLGAAKFFGKELTSTNAGGAIGTPLYMAPEQIKGEVVDARTDVYALGTILYEMLAGRHPFAQPSGDLPPAFEIGTLHLHAQPRPLSEVVEGLPEHVWRVVERAVAKDPARRYATMDDFAKAIQTSRRRILDDPSAGKVACVIPIQRAPQYAEPSEVAAANEHHSGVRGVDEFIVAPPNFDTLIDAEHLFASERGERGAKSEPHDPGALSFSELLAESGEFEGDIERAVAGSGRVPRRTQANADAAPLRPVTSAPNAIAPPLVDAHAPAPTTNTPISGAVPVGRLAPEVSMDIFQTALPAGLAPAPRAINERTPPAPLTEPAALARLTAPRVNDTVTDNAGPPTWRSQMEIVASPAEIAAPLPEIEAPPPTLDAPPPTIPAPPLGVVVPSSPVRSPSKPRVYRGLVVSAALLSLVALVISVGALVTRPNAPIAISAIPALQGLAQIDFVALEQSLQRAQAEALVPEPDLPSDHAAPSKRAPSTPGGIAPKAGTGVDCSKFVLFVPLDHPECSKPPPSGGGSPSAASSIR